MISIICCAGCKYYRQENKTYGKCRNADSEWYDCYVNAKSDCDKYTEVTDNE